MIGLEIIIAISITHWIADFVMQTDYMARNKSKSNMALGLHTFVYTLYLLPLYFVLNLQTENFIVFILVNGILHGAIDFVTSRISSKLWENKKVHEFFVCIGLDQTIHYIVLFSSYVLLK